MASIIGAVMFSIITIMTIMLVCGLPLGEFTMGGQPKVLPKNLRIIAAGSIILQLFAIVIVLQAGGHMDMWFSGKVTRIICYIYCAYLIINTFMNSVSRSKKEKYVMTPMSSISAICFAITAWQM